MEKKLKRPRDPVQLAKLIGDIATGQTEDKIDDGKSADAVERGRKGGITGGKSRMEKLGEAERHELAKKAATARWPQDKQGR